MDCRRLGLGQGPSATLTTLGLEVQQGTQSPRFAAHLAKNAAIESFAFEKQGWNSAMRKADH